MKHHIHRPINAVRSHLRMQRGFDYSAWGMIASAPLVPFSPLAALLILLASCLLALMRSCPVPTAARLVDQRLNLKDRTLTSVDLLERVDRTPMEQLQIEDTADHLMIPLQAVMPPLRLKMFWCAFPVSVCIIAAVSYCKDYQPSGNTASVIQTALPPEISAPLEEMIAKTDELAQEHAGEQSLQKLYEQLDVLMNKFVSLNGDKKESLMTLSEMEEAFQSALDSLQLEAMEESLSELAKTLELAEKTSPIGKSLEKGDFSQAAMELRKLDAETLESLTNPEQKAMAEEMQSLADNAEKRSQQPLKEAAQNLSDALEEGDGDSGKTATDDLANEVEKHGVRKEIAKSLAQQQMLLAMMKADGGQQGNMSGGKGTDKSDTASQTWGSGTAGNPNAGQETQLNGQRQRETLTGEMGEQGDSEKETIDSQEMSAAASQREYRDQYQQYQKLSEAVLDSEPIPLGQRQVIRRYFESIRPSSE